MKKLISCCTLLLGALGASAQSPEKTLIDYFQPMPVRGALVTNVWGAPGVWPRDPQNGLEDQTMKQWCYWDGQIIKASDGKFHMFASRWDQAKGHNGWWSSLAAHAVSDNIVGPYIDQGLCWPDNQGGKGHNVTALILPDGRYAVVISETRPGDVFVSKSLNGPWEHLGQIQVATNEFSKFGRMSNVSVLLRPDGDFMIVARSGAIWISKTGILGPYTVQGPSVYPATKGLPLRDLEDPVVWHSGGLYHLVVNGWSTRKAYHITSPNGITDWTFRGLAYDPTKDFLRYTDGTVNHWDKIERPGVVIENGHVTHFTFSVLDVPKDQERGNDTHGSKVIVVPFDGAALDRDLAKASQAASAKPNAPEVLPGKGLAQHDFFYAGEAKEERMFIVRDGKVVWSHTHPGRGEISDAVLQTNGNILFAHQYGVTEINADKKVVWNYDAPTNSEIHTAMPFGSDSVWFVQNSDPAKFVVMNKASGNVEREFVLPVKNPKSIHGHFRHARMTDAGTLLVAHMDLGRAAEYDLNGKEVWSLDVPGIWSATPLKNGNILVVSNQKFVREVNRAKEIVWEWTPADAPEYNFSNLQLAVRLPNGNTIINNWFNQWSGKLDTNNLPVQAIEVTPDKKVVWALRAWTPPADLGPATTIQLLEKN